MSEELNMKKIKNVILKIIGKMCCMIGFHRFTCTLQDCYDEFGNEFGLKIPLDKMPKKAKCCRCEKSPKKVGKYYVRI
jgi:hypothetical protein